MSVSRVFAAGSSPYGVQNWPRPKVRRDRRRSKHVAPARTAG